MQSTAGHSKKGRLSRPRLALAQLLHLHSCKLDVYTMLKVTRAKLLSWRRYDIGTSRLNSKVCRSTPDTYLQPVV